MAQARGIRNLNESRDEALQALLGSPAPTATSSSQNGPKLSADQAKKLSEKLLELVGEAGSVGLEQSRNEKGEEQLVNEEGLPIVEVTEPLAEEEEFTLFEPTAIPDEPDLIPLRSLPPSERERRRIERDKILDLLEVEESMQHARAEELVQAQRHEVSQRHKEGAQSEMENLKAAREMQKKMGKALLRNMAEAREKNEKAQKEASLHDSIAEEQKTTLKPKKSVSFADLPPEGKGESKDRAKLREKEVQLDWGDVAPAKLRSANRTTLMTKAQMNQHPMKLDVVERLPTVRSEPEESIIQVQDSDDESVPSSPISVDSNQSDVIQSDRNIGSLEVADPDSGEDDSEDGLLSDDDEFDLDTARHHREIALAYYDKRDVTGENAAAALTFHTKNEEENEWNQPEVPLDATLSSSQRVSRFKADRIASPYNAPFPSTSTSTIGTSILSASGSQTLQRAIRTGRLENDKLVGGDAGESASEPEDENVKEVLELLKQGQVHNIGPTLDSTAKPSASGLSQPLPLSPPAPYRWPPEAFSLPDTSGAQTTREVLAPTPKSKTSKFKLNRTVGLRPLAGSTLPDSSISTPVSTVERSSPKLPTTSTDGVEHGPSFTSSPSLLSNLEKSPVLHPPSAQFSTVIDSPSFPQPTIVVSPSFPPPRQKPSSDVTLNVSAAPERRLDRPPTVMSAAVLESPGNRIGTGARVEEGKAKKVSRFLSERM